MMSCSGGSVPAVAADHLSPGLVLAPPTLAACAANHDHPVVYGV
jgi:hypothetical protein